MILIGPDVIATTTISDRPEIGDLVIVEDTVYSVSRVHDKDGQVIVNLVLELPEISTKGDNWC